MTNRTPFRIWLNPAKPAERRLLIWLQHLPKGQRSTIAKQILLRELARPGRGQRPKWTIPNRQTRTTLLDPHQITPDYANQVLETITSLEFDIVDEVARHPFLDASDLAQLFETCSLKMKKLLTFLCQTSCLDSHNGPENECLYTLGLTGVHLLAWTRRVTPSVLRRDLQLGRQAGFPIHSWETNRFFLCLLESARARADHELQVWSSEAEARVTFSQHGKRRALRPDGYGVYRIGQTAYHFFLEWDRGTSGTSRYDGKLERYGGYYKALLERGPTVAPALWTVTTTLNREQIILEKATSFQRRIGIAFPLLVTVKDELRNEGPLGPIWLAVDRHIRNCFFGGP